MYQGAELKHFYTRGRGPEDWEDGKTPEMQQKDLFFLSVTVFFKNSFNVKIYLMFFLKLVLSISSFLSKM